MSGRLRRGLIVPGLAIAWLLSAAPGAGALTLQQVGSYTQPVYVTSDPGDPDRLFVVERAGKVKLTEGGQTSTFLDLTSLVPPPMGDRGLLSMAFAPDFGQTGHLYFFYAGAGGELRIDEFTGSGDSAALATRRPVLAVPHDAFAHYGGQLQFGPDGYLYASTGDNFFYFGPDAGADPLDNGQNLETLHSKLLRIDPHPSGGAGYTVPADNPYVGVPGRDEIWATGLRNPWRFSFDRATGDLAIADVGQDDWEEVNFAPSAAGGGRADNYGWSCREGPDPYKGCAGSFDEPSLARPHAGTGCTGSITGGYVVRDPGLPELAGRYVYSDFCAGELRSARLATPAAVGDRSEGVSVAQPTSFGEDACGRVYVASLAGPVYRLAGSGPGGCAPATAGSGFTEAVPASGRSRPKRCRRQGLPKRLPGRGKKCAKRK